MYELDTHGEKDADVEPASATEQGIYQVDLDDGTKYVVASSREEAAEKATGYLKEAAARAGVNVA